jgi:glycosyltransferase 2 family protein
MNKTLKTFLQYGFFLGLGIFLTYWQYHKMDSGQRKFFAESIRHANYYILIPVFIMSVCSHISRAVRWRFLMEPLGYKPPLNAAFASVMIGYLVIPWPQGLVKW